MRIAVLGANGQVGSEVSLLLARVPGVEVVPVCRNRTGSSFLRWRGMRCRHGTVTDPAQARGLIGDCDVVANFALAIGLPREARRLNRQLAEAAASASAPGARIVCFSSLAVHRGFRPAGTRGGRAAYAKEKLRCERDALRAGRQAGRATWVLRLGHVHGALQGIRDELRQLVSSGPVAVPRGGQLGSNVVHSVTIVDALLKIAAGGERPGCYDLVSSPMWTWREVLSWDAAAVGAELSIVAPGRDPFESASLGFLARWRAGARSAADALLASPQTREVVLSWIAHLPESLNLRAQLAHFRRRASAEIACLETRLPTYEAFAIPPVTPRPLRTLSPTAELLRAESAAEPLAGAGAFPPDLPAHSG